MKETVNKPNNARRRKIQRWEIGWIVLLVLGPTSLTVAFVILMFDIQSATGGWFFPLLGILGIVLYVIVEIALLRAWFRPEDEQSGSMTTTSVGQYSSGDNHEEEAGKALATGLFAGYLLGRHLKNDRSVFDRYHDDFLWQEQIRHDNDINDYYDL